jgi:hypothetical protein
MTGGPVEIDQKAMPQIIQAKKLAIPKDIERRH